MKTAAEIRKEVVERAGTDAAWRDALVRDPRTAMEGHLGAKLPASLTIQVHEESAGVAHIVLPPKDALGERELSHASAGFSSAPESMSVLNW